MAPNNKQPAAGPGRYVWLVGLLVGVLGGAMVAVGLFQLA